MCGQERVGTSELGDSRAAFSDPGRPPLESAVDRPPEPLLPGSCRLHHMTPRSYKVMQLIGLLKVGGGGGIHWDIHPGFWRHRPGPWPHPATLGDFGQVSSPA